MRFCWSTTKTLLQERALDCEWEAAEEQDDDDNEEGGDHSRKKGASKSTARSQSITKFLKRTADESADGQGSAKRRCGERSQTSVFFSDRDLKRVTCLQDLI